MRQFKRFSRDMRDRLDRLDTTVTNLHRGQHEEAPNARIHGRQEPRMGIREEYEYGSDLDEEALVEAEMGRMRNR